MQASGWVVFCKSCGVAFPGKTLGQIFPKEKRVIGTEEAPSLEQRGELCLAIQT